MHGCLAISALQANCQNLEKVQILKHDMVSPQSFVLQWGILACLVGCVVTIHTVMKAMAKVPWHARLLHSSMPFSQVALLSPAVPVHVLIVGRQCVHTFL